MTLEQAYYISHIVAVIAIIGSLVAIYFQQRQTNRIARAQFSQVTAANYSDTLREFMKPELAAIFRKVMFERTELSPVESTQNLVYFNLTMVPLRDAFFGVRDGMIDERLLEDLVQNACWYLTAPVFATEWRRVQQGGIFGLEFSAYVNGRFAKLHPGHDASLLLSGGRDERV